MATYELDKSCSPAISHGFLSAEDGPGEDEIRVAWVEPEWGQANAGEVFYTTHKKSGLRGLPLKLKE